METLKAIMTRRSVRRFVVNKPVPSASVDKILKAAMSAPSAVNEQPWQFLVIDDRNILDKIPTVHPHAQMCLQSPLAIMLCVDMTLGNYRDYWVQDMSASAQNILLAAHDLGLGAVWVGVYTDDVRVNALQRLFVLPEHVIPFAIVPIGYSSVVQGEAPERMKKERIHYNKW